MIRTSLSIVALVAASQTAVAGGIERNAPSVGVLFETGKYLEFSVASIRPNLSGVGVGIAPSPATPTPGQASGNMAPSFSNVGLALKMPLSEKIDAAIILDQPYGADTAYPVATAYFARGSTADLNTQAATGIIKYKFNDNFSAYAGLRAQTMDATAAIPFIPGGGYSVTGENDVGFGYLLGAAYERPDIAMRVALTYNSAIKHELATTETSALGAGRTSTSTIETPRSVNLEVQTGIAKDTLVFGGVRWTEWSKFKIAPTDYMTLTTAPLVSYDDDVFTYKFGVGRRLNETWSVAGSMTYEKSNGGFSSNLAPKDGLFSLGVGVTYTLDNMKLTAGVSHSWLGDAETRTAVTNTTPASSFKDNTATAFGLKLGFNF